MRYFETLRKSISEVGLYRTMIKIGRMPRVRLEKARRAQKKKRFENEALGLENLEDRFTWIYRNNKWGDSESVSGPGSTRKHTQELRRELPRVVRENNVQSILDAPCGDFNWMKLVIDQLHIDYIGADVVEALINKNRERFGAQGIRFQKLDLVTEAYPDADLMICRDCLFHFSHADIVRALRNFAQSDIGLLLTTSYVLEPGEHNQDIRTGQFRPLDLRAAPYFFPEPIDRICDWVVPERPRFMFLWSRGQVTEAVMKLRTATQGVQATRIEGNSC